MNLSLVRIFVVGPRESGKTTFTLMLRNELGCCPWFDIGESLMMYLARIRVGTNDSERLMADLAYIRTNKNSFRSDLIALADVLREIHPSGLIHHGFTKAPIVASVRKRMEMDAYCKGGFQRGGGPEFLFELCRDGAPLDNYELAGCHTDPWNHFAATMEIPNEIDKEHLKTWAVKAAELVKAIAPK